MLSFAVRKPVGSCRAPVVVVAGGVGNQRAIPQEAATNIEHTGLTKQVSGHLLSFAGTETFRPISLL